LEKRKSKLNIGEENIKGYLISKPFDANEVSLLQLRDIAEKSGKTVKLLLDSDILCYRSASSVDGREYNVVEGDKLTSFKYKKDAVKYCKENSISEKKAISIKYTPGSEDDAVDKLKSLVGGIKWPFKRAKVPTAPLVHCLTPKDVDNTVGDGNIPTLFRSIVYPGYKAGRIGGRIPENLIPLRKVLLGLGDTVTRMEIGLEADDLLGILSKETYEGREHIPVIVSLDKDLDQLPGYHYNFVKKYLYFVTEEEGRLALYKQLLTGDSTDSIPGIKGLGKKTADKLLDPLKGEEEIVLWEKCKDAYNKAFPTASEEEVFEMMVRNMRLLYLLRTRDDLWNPPTQSKE